MSSDQEWFTQKLSELEINDDKIQILSEIKNRLETTATPTEITSNFLTQSLIFDFACDKSEDKSNLAVDILAVCLSNLDISANDFTKQLIRSLKNRNPKVCAKALDEIYKNVLKYDDPERNSDATANGINQLDQDLILLIIKKLQATEIEVAGPAIKILSIVLKNHLENSTVEKAFKNLAKEKDVVKIRAYEVAINLAKIQPNLLVQLQDVLDQMLSELDSDDILFQMNLLELLCCLAEQNHGFSFMEEKKVFDNIALRVENIEEDPLMQFLVPGFMKFFGRIAFYQPRKIMEGYPNIILYLFNSFNQLDMNILPAALDTLGNLAGTAEGKIVLDENFPQQMKEVLEDYATFLRNLPTDMKCRIFASLIMIFTHKGEPNNRIDLITKNWCTYVADSEHDLSGLMEYIKNPFPDIKLCCLSFIKTLCSYRWGIDALNNTAGLLELLMNRAIEFDKDVKYVKFEIISVLAESDQFDVSTVLQLKRYVAEGPYFVEPIMEVAVD